MDPAGWLLERVALVVWAADEALRFSRPQPAWERFTGQPWSVQEGRGWLSAFRPADRERVEGACAAAPARGALEVAARLWHAGSASYRHVVLHALPSTADGGWLGAVAGDAAAAAAALDDERARGRRKDEFLAVLGHELRNPLAPILTALELLRLRGAGGERERSIIHSHVLHVIRLADDLLDVSRVARGTLRLSIEVVDVAAVLARAVEHALPLLEQRGHALRVDVDPALRAEADPVRLAQVMGNLLTNAARYTPPGGHVGVEAALDGGALVLRVRDDGRGIAREDQARVFEPFVQLRGQAGERAPGGLGIGLALVRSLVELHGGAVEVASDGPGRGSAFTVRLPQRAGDDEGARAASGRHAPARGRRVERVLVVDDNADAADTLVEALADLSYQVRVAYTGEEAVEAYLEQRPEVVLLDLGLPGIDGLEVARRIRRAPGGRAPRLVALTGFGQDDDLRACLEAGCDEHMLKPVDLSKLLERVERV